MRNDGKDAQRAFLKIMDARGAIVERLWDQADLRGLNRGRSVIDYPKPSDFLVTQNGRLEYAEVKSVQSSVSFPFANIERGQKSAALRQAAVGGPYNFYLFTFGLGEWFVLPCAVFAATLEAGRASIKFSELDPWI